jgi:hypothetical protein
MSEFKIAAMVVAAATLVSTIPAQAEMNGGGPIRKGNQCWHYSSAREAQLGGFGYWAACPQTASATTTTPVKPARKPRAATR